MIRKIAALSLALIMALGLSACGAQTADYMAEVQRVSQWECYETQVDLTLSVEGAERIPMESAEMRVQTKTAVDRKNGVLSLSAGLKAELDGLRLYGTNTDVQTTYDMQPIYMRGGIVYLPVQMIRDALMSDDYGWEYYGDNLAALEEPYIALDLAISEEDLAAVQQMQQGVYTPEQFEQLGQWLSGYTTGLRFSKSGRAYTLSGQLSQLPEEVAACGRFLCENIRSLNDILDLGMTEEDVADMEQTAQEMEMTEQELEELQAELKKLGIAGDFSCKITFADDRVTEDMTVRLSVEGYGDWTLKAQSVSRRLSSFSPSIPAAAGPMTATELENLIHGWSEETTQVSAWVDLEDGWTTTSYWDGTPAYDYTYIEVREENGETLLGFRALMEAMGFTVDYDAASDTVSLVNRAGERTAVELFEENGRAFISVAQLRELNFDVEEYEDSLDILYFPPAQ